MIPLGDPWQRALRHEKKWQRIGDGAHCADCGNADIRCLRKDGHTGAIACECCRKKKKPLSQSQADRRRRHLAESGFPNAVCSICAESDVATLELHHLAGKANSSIVAPVCGNCHAILSDSQIDLTADLMRLDPVRRPLQLQAAFEFGLALLMGARAIAEENPTTSIVLGMIVVALIGWAAWNISADQHLSETHGPNYCKGVSAPVPA